MAYDRGRGLTVLFGGTTLPGPIYWDDTWEWDGATWSARTTANIPHARENHAVAYDSSRGVTVLFGGDYYGGQQPLDDTWEYGIHVPDGDLDESGSADGRDIAPFVAAVIAGSTDPTALYHADFSGNGVIDLDDVPGFVQKLVGP